MEKGSIKIGIGAAGLSFFLFLAVVSDTILFIPQPWSYADGAGWEKITLSTSVFWKQYVKHCHFIEPTILGLIIWRYWVIPFGIGLGILILATKEAPEMIPFPQAEDIADSGGKIVLLGLGLMYLWYGLKKPFMLTPLGMIIIVPNLIVIPAITYQLIYRGIKKSEEWYILGVVFWFLIDLLSMLFVTMLLFGGCE